MFYKILSAMIFISGISWIVLALTDGSLIRPTQVILGVHSAADSQLLIPKSEFDAVFDNARALMFDINERGNLFSLLENICKWLAVFASALITLVAGLSGKIVNPQAMGEIDEKRLPDRFLRTIAIIAAINAICLGLSAPFQAEKFSAYKQADQIKEKALQVRIKVLESKDAVEQQSLLDSLQLEMSR